MIKILVNIILRKWLPGPSPIAVPVAAVTMILLPACSNPFNPLDDNLYLKTNIPKETLRDINPINLTDYEKPDNSTDNNPDDATATTPPPDLQITIEQARAYALENNLDLKVQLLDPLITRQSITEAEAAFESFFSSNINFNKTDTPTASTLTGSKTKDFNANLGVNIPLRTGGTLTFNLPTDRFATDNQFSTLNPAYTTNFTISLSQPLLRNAGVRTNTYGIRIAHYQTQTSEAQTKLAVINVLAAVDRAYWNLYAFRRALEVRKEEYDLAGAQLTRAQHQVKAGTLAEVEVIRAQSGVAQRLENIIIAENAVRNSQRELKRILNIPEIDLGSPTILILQTQPNPVEFHLDAEKLASTALEHRMEMLELQIQIASNTDTIDLRKNQLLPLFDFSYSYNINGLGSSYGGALDVLFDRNFADNRFGLRIEIPIGNEAAESRYRQAIYNRLKTLASKTNRITLIRQEIFNAVDQIEANWQRILASRHNAILAARTLAAEERQFEIGLQTSTDVDNAQAAFADAQLSEIQALTAYQISQVNLAVATGMTLGADKVRWQPTQPDTK